MARTHSTSKLVLVGIAFVLGGIFGGFLSGAGSDLYNMTREWVLSSVFPLTLPQLLFSILAIIGITLIIIGFWKKSPNKLIKPNFDHVIACFFYPEKYSWDKGERDPNKIVPRLKLVLVTDSEKGYYIGDYIMKLVKNRKIKWLSEDKQDLNEWCKNTGYKLIPEIGTEEKILEPCFKAEILNKKQEYHRGDKVFFKSYFRGLLNHGFLSNKIVNSEGKKFPSGQFHRQKNRDYSWAPDTLKYRYKWIPNFLIRGKLDGYVKHQTEWCWIVPYNAPFGEYRISMCVYNNWLPCTAIKEIQDTIIVG